MEIIRYERQKQHFVAEKTSIMSAIIGRKNELKELQQQYTSSKAEMLVEHLSCKTSIQNTLITTYGLQYNEYSGDFGHVITLDDLFKE